MGDTKLAYYVLDPWTGEAVRNSREKPIRRCQSTAPVHGNQCENRRKHNKTDELITHKSGDLIWHDNGRHEHVEPPAVKKINDWMTDVVRFFEDKYHVPTPVDPSSFFANRTKPKMQGARPTFTIKDETHIFRNGGHLYGFNHIPPVWTMPLTSTGMRKHSTTSDHNPVHKDNDSVRRETVTEYGSTDRQRVTIPEPVVDGVNDSVRRDRAIMHSMCTEPCGPECDVKSGAQRAREASRRPVPLDQWWRQISEDEIAATVPKAVEYGATDLIDIGVQLGKWMKRPLTDAEAAELGCWFYLIGKMARATSAQDRGEMPSDDTIKDIGVYIKMIQRIRAAGSWPGEELKIDG